MQQQPTGFPALTLHLDPQFSVGHLHNELSSPLANAFSEGSISDFKQEFPREPDALHGGEEVQS